MNQPDFKLPQILILKPTMNEMKTNHLLCTAGIKSLLMPFATAQPPVLKDQVVAVNSDESIHIFNQFQNVILTCLL